MSKAMVKIILVGCILVTTLLWAAESRPRQPAAPQASMVQEIKDPYLHSRVLVEAFVVDVNLSALYEKGVSPLGEKPHSVTVQDLLQYLKATKNAGIMAGAKLSIQQRGRAETKGERTIYVGTMPKEGGSRQFHPYNSGRTLSAQVNIVSEGAISVSYAFQVSDLDKTPIQEDQTPPQNVHWSWSGDVTVEPGKPIVAGAVQEEDSAIFLVLVAHLQ